LVSLPEVSVNFPIRDLRHIWRRKLGISLPFSPSPLCFPAPLDSTILLRHENRTVPARFQGLAPVQAILDRSEMIFDIDPGDTSLFLEGDLISSDSNVIAYDLYGKVIRIE
jgi:hypothetical protein